LLRAAGRVNRRRSVGSEPPINQARNTAEDVVALPRWHAYANLVANGRPSGWALVETLPPLPGTRDVEQVRQIIRDNYAPLPAEDVPDAEPQESTAAADEEATLTPDEGERIGRKRRTGGKR
ncbi:hypothetical protein, partial [Nocardiopsis changdeensis]|uniref:hypothetical protein n=1 Tax=Nocardiopsis changdeensis TaxID=2831969 RepID=UPI003F4580AA